MESTADRDAGHLLWLVLGAARPKDRQRLTGIACRFSSAEQSGRQHYIVPTL